MSELKDQLIKLGSEQPDLRPDLEPVIDRLSSYRKRAEVNFSQKDWPYLLKMAVRLEDPIKPGAASLLNSYLGKEISGFVDDDFNEVDVFRDKEVGLDLVIEYQLEPSSRMELVEENISSDVREAFEDLGLGVEDIYVETCIPREVGSFEVEFELAARPSRGEVSKREVERTGSLGGISRAPMIQQVELRFDRKETIDGRENWIFGGYGKIPFVRDWHLKGVASNWEDEFDRDGLMEGMSEVIYTDMSNYRSVSSASLHEILTVSYLR